MELIKEFQKKELIFDNIKTKSCIKTINLFSDVINIDFCAIIDTQFMGGNIGQSFEELKKELNMGLYSKAPCGGFVNFYKVTSNLGNEYVVYSGVNEVSNSHYLVTVHRIYSNSN